MAEANTVTGGRDDLAVDLSRCLKMRFGDSACCHCLAICPHGAVKLEGNLTLESASCLGCLLCSSVCPAGAIEQRQPFAEVLAQLCKVPEPVLGCIRTASSSHARIACLGGLSEEHLLALRFTLANRVSFVTLNLLECADCPNNPMLVKLRERLAATAGDEGCGIRLAESAEALRYRDEALDRRSFFKSFSRSFFKSASIIVAATNPGDEVQTDYQAKKIPARRELLNSLQLPEEIRSKILRRYEFSISVDEKCSACQGCIAICPTGALTTDTEETPPLFSRHLCTGCGLCREFCLDEALHIAPLSKNGI